jgi:cyclic beta-1,2-glucan synthetase
MPFLMLWALSPAVIYLTSLRPKDSSFTDDQKHHLFFLKETRKIWGFFDTYVDDKNNYLPPDNVQTHPGPIIANRTSPTNIGLYLLSTTSAHDLGYISINNLIDRLSNTYDSLKKMDRYNGHFYNWYDTHTLSPLHPIYISTVDSGNFCVYLHIVKQAVLEYLNRPVLDMQALVSGLRTTIDLAYDGYKDADKAQLKEIADQINLYKKHSVHSFFNHIIHS